MVQDRQRLEGGAIKPAPIAKGARKTAEPSYGKGPLETPRALWSGGEGQYAASWFMPSMNAISAQLFVMGDKINRT